MSLVYWAYMITSLLVVVTFVWQVADPSPVGVSSGLVRRIRMVAFFVECLLIFLAVIVAKIIADRWDAIEFVPALAGGVVHMGVTTGLATIGVFVFLRRIYRSRGVKSQASMTAS